jgi:hypothetical protein
MTTKDQFLAQIDELVVKHTFGLEALEGIKKLKDTMAQVTAERDRHKADAEARDKINSDQYALVAKRDAEIYVLKQALADMQKAADDGRKAVYEAEKHKAVADTWQSAMAMVFKPNAVRETVQRNVMKPVEGSPGGNGSYASSGFLAAGNESETIVREDA